jgi:hypothetical protein
VGTAVLYFWSLVLPDKVEQEWYLSWVARAVQETDLMSVLLLGVQQLVLVVECPLCRDRDRSEVGLSAFCQQPVMDSPVQLTLDPGHRMKAQAQALYPFFLVPPDKVGQEWCLSWAARVVKETDLISALLLVVQLLVLVVKCPLCRDWGPVRVEL